MASKDRFNPIQTLSEIMDRHEGTIDSKTMQSYLSFISFLSLLNIYQNMTPHVAATGFSNSDLSEMFNKFMGSGNIDQSSLSSLLSSIPPDTMQKVNAMLGGGGGPKKSGFPLGGLMSMLAKNPGMLSMLGNSLDSSGLGSLLGGGAGAGSLGSLLGGTTGGIGGLAPLLKGLGGKESGKGLQSLLGKKGLGGLGTLGGLESIAALAPMMPYVSSFGKKLTKTIGKKIHRRRRSKSKTVPESDMEQHLTKILKKSNKYSQIAPYIPQLAALANSGDINSALPVLLPLVAKNSKIIKKNLKTGLKPLACGLKPVAKVVSKAKGKATSKPAVSAAVPTDTGINPAANPVITQSVNPPMNPPVNQPIKKDSVKPEPVKTITQSNFPLKNATPIKIEKTSTIPILGKNY